jgi:hypothetical protein
MDLNKGDAGLNVLAGCAAMLLILGISFGAVVAFLATR